MAFSFDQIFAADPSNPSNVAQDASITIFAPGDSSMTPLTITDPDGQPLANPIPVNANGFGSAFAHATLDRVAWAGGGFTGFFTSYEGMKQVAVDAQAAAEAAAGTAATDATLRLDELIAAGSFEGPAGPLTNLTVGTVEATPGNPLTDDIVASEVLNGTATTAALNATYADPLALNLQRYGLPGSGIDRTAALQALLTDAAVIMDASGQRKHDGSFGPVTRLVEVPAGVWEISAFLTVPETVSVHMHPNAIIRARTAIAGAMIRTPVGKSWRGQFFMGGTIDCNQLADDGLLVNVGSKSSIEHVTIQDFKRYGVYLGTTGEVGSCFEIGMTDVIPARRVGLTPPAGSVGVYINNASDCSFDKVNPVGSQRGIWIGGGNHKFSRCHSWGYPGAFPEICFDDRGGAFNTYFQCVADSPSVAGWNFEAGYSYLDGCTVLIHPDQLDNTIVGVQLAAGAVALRAVGCRFQGASGSVRLAADFKSLGDDSWLNTSTIIGQETYDSVVKTKQRNMLPPYSVVGQVVERSLYIPGTVTATDLPPSVFWSVPVQADSVVIRAGSGTGTQFQIWQGGTQLTPTFDLGDVATLNSPFGSGVPVNLAAFAGMYIKVVTAGTGNGFSVVFKAYQNG